MKTKKQLIGKRAKASGARFELFVRKDLEKKGWICDKWTNNVEFEQIEYPVDSCCGFTKGKLVKVKPKFVYNPILKRRVMIGNSSGFPDFIIYRKTECMFCCGYEVIGCESKTNGILDKEEKEKCSWLLSNGIFSKILIAKKIKVGRRIVVEYKEFKESKT